MSKERAFERLVAAGVCVLSIEPSRRGIVLPGPSSFFADELKKPGKTKGRNPGRKSSPTPFVEH